MSATPSPADRRSRLRDVAQIANVSIATVDRVLNNRGKVRQLTAQRVLAAAEQIKYLPASELLGSAQKKVGVLGVIIPAGPYHFFRKLETAFERLKERAIRHGVTILIRTPPHQDWEAMVKLLQNDAQLFDQERRQVSLLRQLRIAPRKHQEDRLCRTRIRAKYRNCRC